MSLFKSREALLFKKVAFFFSVVGLSSESSRSCSHPNLNNLYVLRDTYIHSSSRTGQLRDDIGIVHFIKKRCPYHRRLEHAVSGLDYESAYKLHLRFVNYGFRLITLKMIGK